VAVGPVVGVVVVPVVAAGTAFGAEPVSLRHLSSPRFLPCITEPCKMPPAVGAAGSLTLRLRCTIESTADISRESSRQGGP
jgi:hypothetical protein